MPRCTLRCYAPEDCGEPCVDQYEAAQEADEPPYDWGE